MRKPASDVAGIEEVNVKQDKIGYTPADDSKVVHDNHDNTITPTSVEILAGTSSNFLPPSMTFAAIKIASVL